jgi:hypothetical protein
MEDSRDFLFGEHNLAELACIFRQCLVLNLVIKFAETDNELTNHSSIFY